MKASALLIIDVQNCFLPGGVLPTLQGASIIPNINLLRQEGEFSIVVVTQDWHPRQHVSFASSWQKKPSESISLSYTAEGRLCNHTDKYPQNEVLCRGTSAGDMSKENSSPSGRAAEVGGYEERDPSGGGGAEAEADAAAAAQAGAAAAMVVGANGQGPTRNPEHAGAAPVHLLEQKLWPDHCIANTDGAALHPKLKRSFTQERDYLIRKGADLYIDAYSAFYDNGKFRSTGLSQLLRSKGVDRVVVVGVAFDYCVLWSAKDAAEEGFEVVVVQDAVAPVSKEGEMAAVQELKEAGVQLIKSTAEYLKREGKAGVQSQTAEL